MSSLIVETWAWYGLTLVIFVARLVSRCLFHGSAKKLQLDDYVMSFAMCTYTALAVCVHVLTYTPTNLINPADPVELTPENIKERILGSKLVIVVEQMQILTIWSVKTCLANLNIHSLLVKIVAGYTAVGFVVMEILFFAVWCRPFWHYWQVPPESIQCSAEHNHMITNAVLNISSDIMIIALPMPVFLLARLQLKKKAILCSLFALGIFTILCAILNKYYSFSQLYGTEWIYWYIREASTAVIVANLPLTWTLFQRLFNLESFHNKSSGRRTATTDATPRFRSAYGNLSSRITRGKDRIELDEMSASESQEQINQPNSIPLRIYRQHEAYVTTEGADGTRTPQRVVTAGVTFRVNGTPQSGLPDEEKSTGDSDIGVVTTAHGGV